MTCQGPPRPRPERLTTPITVMRTRIPPFFIPPVYHPIPRTPQTPPVSHLGLHLSPHHTSHSTKFPPAATWAHTRLPIIPQTPQGSHLLSSPPTRGHLWLHTTHVLLWLPLPSRSHTCDLVPNQLAGLDVTNAAEETLELILGHILGQVVDNEVGLAVISGSVCTKEWPVGQGRAGRAPCHLRLHGAEYLLETTGHTHSWPGPHTRVCGDRCVMSDTGLKIQRG